MRQGTAKRQGSARKRWLELLRCAQDAVAAKLCEAVASPGFGREEYLGWLAREAAVAVLCADAMKALAGWHPADPVLCATAEAWAADLRGMAWLAAADLREGKAGMPSPSPLLDAWSGFLGRASGSQRAGEALGAVALHSCLLPGCADEAVAAMRALPFARPASRYLARRSRADAPAVRADRDRLLEAYAAAALAAGAQRAAAWSLEAIPIVHATARG